MGERAGYQTLVALLWRKEYSSKPGTTFLGNGKFILTEAEQEVARLKKELRETQMDRDILKSFYSVRTSGIANTTEPAKIRK